MSFNFLAILTAVSIGAQAVGRIIPDDKTGVLGTVRQVAKVVGLYVPNQVTSGQFVQQNTVAPETLQATAQDVVQAVTGSTTSTAAKVAESVALDVAGKMLDDGK